MLAWFLKDRSGNLAVMFGLMLPVVLAAGGGGLEIARALEYKQRLTSAADLTCWQAQRYVEGTYADNPNKNFKSDVEAYGTKNKGEKNLSNATFSVSPQPEVKPTQIIVTANGSSDLVLKTLMNRTSIPFTLTRTCAVNLASQTPGKLLVSESFEDGHNVASNSWTVLGNNQQNNAWNGWTTQNAGVEINGQPQLTGDSIRFGNFFAELDSDCQGRRNCPHTNSAMSRTLTLSRSKTYEIRYWYVARKRLDVDANPYPGKSQVCSTSASSTGAQRNTEVNNVYNNMTKTGPAKDQQTRRIELYVEYKNSGYIDFTDGNNTDYSDLADVCIWSDDWIERVYTFTPSRSGEYRITWAAAGKEDTYGGLIDYLRICEGSCS